MRFKTGLVVGAGVGYYLGAAAGRARYDQLRRLLDRAGSSGAVTTVGSKARAVIDLTLERARDAVDARVRGGSHQASPPPGTITGVHVHRDIPNGKAVTLNGVGA
ncbi:MAG: YtxH domain-containing protein [Acidimicrobiales bacterium]